MPHHETVTLSGVIQHVFAHRFTLDAEGQTYLADLGPKSVGAFALAPGLAVTLKGERRPSEIKVALIGTRGGEPVRIVHKDSGHGAKNDHEHEEVDLGPILAAVRDAGWEHTGEPRRKKKHFEVLARRNGGDWTELHVKFDGRIRKEKPADLPKWKIDA